MHTTVLNCHACLFILLNLTASCNCRTLGPWKIQSPLSFLRKKDNDANKVNTDLHQSIASDLEYALEGRDKELQRLEAGKACVPQDAWMEFEGDELHAPEAVAELVKSGIEIAAEEPISPRWKQASSSTPSPPKPLSLSPKQFLEQIGKEVLVWTSKFDDHCYGHELPIVKSRAIIPMSPKEFTTLLMDSTKVNLYNKISLGRKDEKVFQSGIDTTDGDFGSGETKIVRNLTQPPLTKKKMEFVTLMHARRLAPEDGLGEGYIIVSRAISSKLEREAASTSDNAVAKQIRSEILLGVNVVRNVEDNPNQADLISVTHVNSPLVPKMVAKKLGVKGAYDFVNDIRKAGE